MTLDSNSAQRSGPTEQAPLVQATPQHYPGFWRRLGAFALDITLLGIIGQLLGFFFAPQFEMLGQSGRWIGVVIAGAYFIPCHRLSGQTLGKRLLGIRVQRVDGTPLTTSGSAIRYLGFAVPWFANGLYFSGATWPWAVLIVAGVVFGSVLIIGLLGDAYLLIFNRPSRRLIHDFMATTVVVPAGTDRHAVPISDRRLRSVHAVVIGLIPIVIVGAVYLFVASAQISTAQFGEMRAAQASLDQLPGVTRSGLTEQWQTFNGNKRHVVRIGLWIAGLGNLTTMPPVAHQAVMVVAEKYPPSHDVDAITVNITSGFDIGIASRWRSVTDTRRLADW